MKIRVYTFIIDEQKPDSLCMAMFLSLILNEEEAAMSIYNNIMSSIRFLIGKSNDLTPLSLISHMKEFGITSINDITSYNTVLEFTQYLNENVSPPQIPGKYNRDLSVPLIFHFTGQRFTLDAMILALLSHPETDKRWKVKT